MPDYDVPEESQTHDPGGVSDPIRSTGVRVTRLRFPARVIVRYGEGASVPAQHGVEDLAHRHQRAVDLTVRDDDRSQRTVGGVADDHDHTLARKSTDLTASDRGDVRWAANDVGRLRHRRAPGKLECGHQARRRGR